MTTPHNQELYPDVDQVLTAAKILYYREKRKEIGLQERVGQSVPLWLIAVAVVFYCLSAPHTAETFNRLTPGWGFVAPIGVEFGLLYAAFRRKQIKTLGEETPYQLITLARILFTMGIGVNGYGALAAVLHSGGLDGLSIGAIIARFGELAAVSQAALFLVPLIALAIPFSINVVGEGLAALLLTYRATGNVLDQRWAQERADIEFMALRNAAINAGIPTPKAINWASRIAGSKVMIKAAEEYPALPASAMFGQVSNVHLSANVQSMSDSDTSRTNKRTNGQTDNGQYISLNARRGGKATQIARAYFTEHPEALNIPSRNLVGVIAAGKTTIDNVQREMKEELSKAGKMDTKNNSGQTDNIQAGEIIE